MRQAAGENLELPVLNEQRNLEQLGQRRRELEEEIELERNLTVGDSRFLGAAVIVPLSQEMASQPEAPESQKTKQIYDEPAKYEVDAGVDVERQREIELVGMRVAMAHERAEGWQPEDVSGENHGFDVRSIRYGEDEILAGVRYIEVKARAASGAIRLSANEWKKARRYGEQSWLHIVTRAGTDSPELQRIQDPTARFAMAG